MLQVATFDVISVAAAVATHTTTTMPHAGKTLKYFKSEKDFKLTHKQKLWGFKLIQKQTLKDRKQSDLPESFQLNSEVSRQTWFGCSFGQSKPSAEQEDQLPRHFSFDYFPVNQALWKPRNCSIDYETVYSKPWVHLKNVRKGDSGYCCFKLAVVDRVVIRTGLTWYSCNHKKVSFVQFVILILVWKLMRHQFCL